LFTYLGGLSIKSMENKKQDWLDKLCDQLLGKGSLLDAIDTKIKTKEEKIIIKERQIKKMNYYFEVFKKYAVFDGRARRKEYWMFFLFNFLILLALSIIGKIADINSEDGWNFLNGIYWLATVIPLIAVGVRRMHDVNKSGWYLLIPIYNLILACTDGTRGNNEYGLDPREVGGVGGVYNQNIKITAKPDKTTNTAMQHDNIKYCGHCGVRHTKDTKFCSSCGKPFREVE